MLLFTTMPASATTPTPVRMALKGLPVTSRPTSTPAVDITTATKIKKLWYRLLNCVTSNTNINTSAIAIAIRMKAMESACSSLAPRNATVTRGSNAASWIHARSSFTLSSASTPGATSARMKRTARPSMRSMASTLATAVRRTKLPMGTRPLAVVILRSSKASRPRAEAG